MRAWILTLLVGMICALRRLALLETRSQINDLCIDVLLLLLLLLLLGSTVRTFTLRFGYNVYLGCVDVHCNLLPFLCPPARHVLAFCLFDAFLIFHVAVFGVIQKPPAAVYNLDTPSLVVRRAAVAVR